MSGSQRSREVEEVVSQRSRGVKEVVSQRCQEVEKLEELGGKKRQTFGTDADSLGLYRRSDARRVM